MNVMYTRKNARSVTAFNSIDIRSEQDNVAIPVTAMMARVCISTDIRAEQDNVATPVTAMMARVCISTDIRPATELM